jgi:hypothetical protein
MEGKRAEESSLGSRTVGNKPLVFEEPVDFWPKLWQPRRSRKVPRADTMNLLGSPSDRLISK